MKKYILALIILFVLPVTVFAHSGNTDSNGGHKDGSDYHYHHGYPAHDHYDMNGDGRMDCPYDFDDRTGWNSGTSSNVKSNTINAGSKTNTENRETRLGATKSDWILFIACSLIEIGVISIVLYLVQNKISELKNKHQKITAEIFSFAMLFLSFIPFLLLDYTRKIYQPSINGSGFLVSALALVVEECILSILAGGCIAGIILCIAATVSVKNKCFREVTEPWDSIMWIAMYIPHIPISIIMLFHLFGIVKL